VVYTFRNEVLESPDPRLLLDEIVEKTLPARIEEFVPREPSSDDPANYPALLNWLNTTFPLGLSAKEAALETRDIDGNCQFIIERIKRAYDLKTQGVLPQLLQESERVIMLEAIDELWQNHLYAMDALREGVSLRSYGQKDPLIEYKQEAYIMFDELMRNINNKALGNLFSSHQRLQMFMEHIRNTMMRGRTFGPDSQPQQQPQRPPQAAQDGEGGDAQDDTPKITIPLKREVPKVGRNEPCPCGSGKKYKACCGRLA
jgi:preprotein translocase subunit SecA